MNSGELRYALRLALNRLDEWNNITGCFFRGTGYYYEIQGIIEDSVKIGAYVALNGSKDDSNTILENIEKNHI